MLVFSIIAHTILQAPVQAVAYGRTLKMHPLVALLMTLFGAVFAGLIGAILAVPITAVVINVQRLLKKARGELEAGGENEGSSTDGPALEPSPSEAAP